MLATTLSTSHSNLIYIIENIIKRLRLRKAKGIALRCTQLANSTQTNKQPNTHTHITNMTLYARRHVEKHSTRPKAMRKTTHAAH